MLHIWELFPIMKNFRNWSNFIFKETLNNFLTRLYKINILYRRYGFFWIQLDIKFRIMALYYRDHLRVRYKKSGQWFVTFKWQAWFENCFKIVEIINEFFEISILPKSRFSNSFTTLLSVLDKMFTITCSMFLYESDFCRFLSLVSPNRKKLHRFAFIKSFKKSNTRSPNWCSRSFFIRWRSKSPKIPHARTVWLCRTTATLLGPGVSTYLLNA